MRVFLGVFLPKEIQTDFKTYKQQIRKLKKHLRFVPAPDLHLTFKFLGADVSEESVEQVKVIIENLVPKIKPFDIKFSNIQLGFERDKMPELLNITFEESEDLHHFVKEIEGSLGGGIFKDVYSPRRDFVSHVTIGRLHGNIHKKKINEVNEVLGRATWESLGKKLRIEKFALITSELGKDGPIYKTIAEFELKGKE